MTEEGFKSYRGNKGFKGLKGKNSCYNYQDHCDFIMVLCHRRISNTDILNNDNSVTLRVKNLHRGQQRATEKKEYLI